MYLVKEINAQPARIIHHYKNTKEKLLKAKQQYGVIKCADCSI